MQDNTEDIINSFHRYCAKFSELVIYGAGGAGQMVAEFMEQEKIPVACFSTTSEPEQKMAGSYEVKKIDAVINSGMDTGIIVAVSKKNTGDMLLLLEDRKVSYFYSPEFLYQLFRRKCRESASKVQVQEGYIRRIPGMEFERDVLYLCCPASIGDTLYTAALVKACKEQDVSVRKVCLILKTGHDELGKLFSGADSWIVSDEAVETLERYSLYTQTWKLGNYIYGHFKKTPRLEYYPEYHEVGCCTIVERYSRLVMDLLKPAGLEAFALDKPDGGKKEMRRDVVVMPYAKTAELLPTVFWESLVFRLKQDSYSVYTNIGSEKEKAIQGTRPLTKSLLETARFCEGCAAVISLRSGLCDLLGFTETKLVVINTSEELFREWNLNDVFTRDGIYNINCYGHTSCCYGNRIDEIMGIVGG